jgi:hypothetical protein
VGFLIIQMGLRHLSRWELVDGIAPSSNTQCKWHLYRVPHPKVAMWAAGIKLMMKMSVGGREKY